VAFVRSCDKVPPCPKEPMPAGSKTDPPLAKAEPISDGGSTPGITELRQRRKNTVVKQQRRERSETM